MGPGPGPDVCQTVQLAVGHSIASSKFVQSQVLDPIPLLLFLLLLPLHLIER